MFRVICVHTTRLEHSQLLVVLKDPTLVSTGVQPGTYPLGKGAGKLCVTLFSVGPGGPEGPQSWVPQSNTWEGSGRGVLVHPSLVETPSVIPYPCGTPGAVPATQPSLSEVE